MIRFFEKWKDIIGYEESYQVSNYGRIRSKNRIETNKLNVKRQLKGSLKSTFMNKNGYKLVTLSKNGKNVAILVHLLVAEAFIPNNDGYEQINHKNGKKMDNRASNLMWCSPRENTHHIRRKMKSTSKFVGVSYDIKSVNKPWMSRISVDGNTKYLGRFKTEKEAYDAYLKECKINNVKIRKL